MDRFTWRRAGESSSLAGWKLCDTAGWKPALPRLRVCCAKESASAAIRCSQRAILLIVIPLTIFHAPYHWHRQGVLTIGAGQRYPPGTIRRIGPGKHREPSGKVRRVLGEDQS